VTIVFGITTGGGGIALGGVMAARAAFAENRQEGFLFPDDSLWGGRAMTQDKLIPSFLVCSRIWRSRSKPQQLDNLRRRGRRKRAAGRQSLVPTVLLRRPREPPDRVRP
jgi:hypothetical protein